MSVSVIGIVVIVVGICGLLWVGKSLASYLQTRASQSHDPTDGRE